MPGTVEHLAHGVVRRRPSRLIPSPGSTPKGSITRSQKKGSEGEFLFRMNPRHQVRAVYPMSKANRFTRRIGDLRRLVPDVKPMIGGIRTSTVSVATHGIWVALLSAGMACASRPALAQSAEPPTPSGQVSGETSSQAEGPQSTRKIYPVRNGSVTYNRIEESERRQTADGEVEIFRVRMPSWSGDQTVLMEREIRTKKLPDGTVEKEHILKNPDATGRLVPTEVIREKIRKSGDSTSVERVVSKPDFSGRPRWRTIRKEHVTETGPETSRRIQREVSEPSIAGGWKVVNRVVTTETTSGDTKESRTLRQIPDAYGELADYELREERVTKRNGEESRETTLHRRDFQDTHDPKFFLVERTISEEKKAPDGSVAVKSTTESDLLAGGATRNVEAGGSRVVEVRSEKRIPGEAGSERSVVNVQERGVVDPRVRPSYEVIQETDREGYVRQVFIKRR